MPYPISIIKEATINLNNNFGNRQDIVNKLTEDLNKSGNEIQIKNGKVKIVRCSEFSSGSSLKDFNRGEIEIRMANDKMVVHFRVYLIEHLIFFLIMVAIGIYGLFEKGLDSVIVKIALLLLTANFVFCYLMPLMTLNSFLKDFINRTLKK